MLITARHTGREYHAVFSRSRGRQQKQLNRELRLRNAEDTLALPSRNGDAVPAGIVIDDVLTTGATVTRAVSLLREEGSRPTAVVVVAAAL
jgi:predicted amidophosphoribosyltransferase